MSAGRMLMLDGAGKLQSTCAFGLPWRAYPACWLWVLQARSTLNWPQHSPEGVLQSTTASAAQPPNGVLLRAQGQPSPS